MSHALAAALGKLRQAEGARLASSTLTRGQQRALDLFAQQTGSVVFRTAGRGAVYEIINHAVVDQQWRQLVPQDAEFLDGSLPIRARNIASARSSKAGAHGHGLSYLLLKARDGAVIWRDDAGNTLDVGLATLQQGASVLALTPDNSWRSEEVVWLVENQAVFDRLDWLPDDDKATVIYYSGQLPNVLIDWLAYRPRARVLRFFPDYDGVGLQNYARLRDRLGASVSLWLMPDWPAKLVMFGDSRLWRDTLVAFVSATTYSAYEQFEPGVLELMRTMQQHGLALEQEAVWLDTSSHP